MSPAHTDSGGVDELILRVQVAEAEVVKISKVWFRVVELVDLVVVKDGGVEDVREGVVCVRVRGVNTVICFLIATGGFLHGRESIMIS